MNHMIHIAAVTQLRHDTDGPDLLPTQAGRGQEAAGGDEMSEAQDLRRHLSPAARRPGARDAIQLEAGPGGQCGASQESSAAGLHPHTSTSDRPLPGPAHPTLRPAAKPRKTDSNKTLEATG